MNFCRECETCSACLRNGCIPIQPRTDAQKEARVAELLRRAAAMSENAAIAHCDPGWFMRAARAFIPKRPSLNLPAIDESLLPAPKETAA